jgi:hypothetical protein
MKQVRVLAFVQGTKLHTETYLCKQERSSKTTMTHQTSTVHHRKSTPKQQTRTQVGYSVATSWQRNQHQAAQSVRPNSTICPARTPTPTPACIERSIISPCADHITLSWPLEVVLSLLQYLPFAPQSDQDLRIQYAQWITHQPRRYLEQG